MKIDDITFSKFVGNALPQSKMIEVERQLIADNEAINAINASIADFELNEDKAEILLGVDEDIIDDNNKINDRITNAQVSEEENIDSETKKKIKMNSKLSQDEVLKVQELVAAFGEFSSNEMSLDENLIQFYLSNRPGTFPEDALDIVKGLHSGINLFNTNLQKALQDEGFNYSAEIENIASELPLNQKYDIYLNFLSAISTLNINNMREDQLSEIENFQSIKGKLQSKGEINEDDVKELEKKIAEVLENNTICLGTTDSLRRIVASLPEGDEAIEAVITGSEKDVKDKLVASMATYILYEKGELKSIEGENITPEMIAISTSLGIEQANVINELNSGRITIDKAIHILKIIGGVALWAFLAYMISLSVSAVAVISAALMNMLLGFSTITNIAAAVFGIFVGWKLTTSMCDTAEGLVNISSRVFDVIVNTWREIAWPRLKMFYENVSEWICSLKERGRITQDNVNEVDLNVAPVTA